MSIRPKRGEADFLCRRRDKQRSFVAKNKHRRTSMLFKCFKTLRSRRNLFLGDAGATVLRFAQAQAEYCHVVVSSGVKHHADVIVSKCL